MKSIGIRPVKHEPLREKVYQEVREALMAGKFEPGAPIRLQVVADAVGTSLMPVREALRRLVAERALIALANRTMIVPFPTAAEFEDILDTRLRLEPHAAGLAAQNMTAKALGEIRTTGERMERTNSVADYLRLNQQFHFGIYRASDRPIMLSHIESLWLHIGPLLNHLLENDPTFRPGAAHPRQVSEHHQAIIGGLAAGDPERTSLAVSEDILTAGQTIVTILRGIEAEREDEKSGVR